MQPVATQQVVPMTTMAAPMTATMAAPKMGMTYMAAPTMMTVAAPTVGTASYVPPPQYVVQQTPSYVPPPQTVQTVVQKASYVAPPVMSAPTMPAVMPGTMTLPTSMPIPQPPNAPPPKLTAGIPDPAQIEKQKVAYAAALDKQLNDAIATVQNETRIEKEMVAFKTQKDIALFETQVDEKLVEQLAAEDERAAFATCQLKKATVERNIALNNQASNLVMDYNMKVALAEIAAKKKAFEQQYVRQEVKLAQDFNQAAMKAGAVPMPMYAAPPPAVAMYAAPPTVVA
jgi:hypothetical protein